MTKRILILTIGLVFSCMAMAQTPSSFPPEKDKFLKVVGQMMTASKSDNLMEVDDEFEKNVKGGAITDAQLAEIIKMTNLMAPRNLAPFPYYHNFFGSINGIIKNKLAADKLTSFLDVCKEVTVSQKKGDNRELSKFLEFTLAMFQHEAMFHTGSKTWMSDAKNYTISYDNGKVVATFPPGKLTGRSTTDTIYVYNTGGKFIPSENKWYGKGGHVDWSRNKLDPNSVYANFKSSYVIAFDNATYSVDSVDFYYKEFFTIPLTGRFTDKFVSGINDSSVSYPRFDSRGSNITLKDVVPNANYTGGFGLWGPRVMGFGVIDSPASVTFYKKDKKRAITAYSLSFTIRRGEEVSSPKAAVMIFNGNDTIFHPELTFTYKTRTNEIKMIRGNSGISRSKFFDSYHNHEFECDAIFWNLDSSRMVVKTLNGIGQVGSVWESNNFFNPERIRLLQGGAPYEPLSIIKKMYEKTGNTQLSAIDLAKAIDPHLTEEQAKPLYYLLVEGGFIRYDEAAGIVTMRPKVINYVMSKAKKVDYDIIHIKSVPKDGSDYIDLKDNNVELKGVKDIPISDTANVVIFPANNAVKIQKDRNMIFDGLVYGGRLDFFGKNYKFSYAPFTIDLNGLDSMRINIPDSNKVDQYGQPKLRTLLTDIIGVKGLLEVDAPINKSGRTRLLQFPKLTSKEKSYASYEDPYIAAGAYKRKDFYFEIDPFKLDSLNAFTPSVINWSGKLVSGGILPDISNKLHIMPDYSLGFEISSPPGGYALYKDGGKYEGDLTLNHKGLSGKGKVNHYSASFTSQDIMFYPDSFHATADSFHISKVQDGVRTPEVYSSGNPVFWKPKSDSMMISMKDKPFAMYENQTSLKGNLLLRASGLRGNGLLDWKEANLKSKDFHFRSDDLSADTASLDIKSASGDKVTFSTPNVNAKIDFKNRLGDFKSNTPDIPTEFAYNNFKTGIAEFKWYIDQKILDFKVPPTSKGEAFTSTRASQLGLNFLGRRATYNLETSILRVEQVPYIYIADAKVVPDSGVVIIQGEAKINQLHNATIFVDTTTSRHKIEKCTIDIISKAELRGSGEYKYSCKDHKDQTIVFNEIKCTKETIGEKKKEQFNEYSLVSKGNLEERDNFYLYPNINYKGEAYLYGRNPNLFFKGFANINLKNPNVTTSDFKILDDVDPEKLMLHYDSATKASNGSKVATGIYFDKTSELPAMYHAVFTQLLHFNDPVIFKSEGVLTYNAKTNEYVMGDETRINKGGLRGNILKYSDEKGTVKCEGTMGLGADFGVIKYAGAGAAEVDLAKKQYTMNMSFGIDLRTNNKQIDEKFQATMLNDNTDLPDISYETERFKMIYSNLADPVVDEKLIKELEVAPVFKRPKDFQYYLVFSDVNFIYDPDDLTLRSYGKIGLAFAGDKGIHKRLDGFIEVGLKNNNINIYLKTGANEWFYYEYKPGSLGLVSSYDDYNRLVGTVIATPAEKRKITGDKGQFYVINLGSTINKGAFLDAMKEKSNPLLPLEKQVVKPKVPKDSTAVKAAPRGADAPAPVSPEKIAPKIDQPQSGDTTKSSTGSEKEKPKSAAQRRADKLREKAGDTAPAGSGSSAPSVADTVAKSAPKPADVMPVKQSDPVPVKPASAVPVPISDTIAKSAPKPADLVPVKQPDPVPVKPASAVPVPVADTIAKSAPKPADVVPVKQPDPVPVKPASAVPVPVADTIAKSAPKPAEVVPVKQPDPVPVKPASAVPVPVADTIAKSAPKPADVVPVKQPDPVPVKPASAVPVPISDTIAKSAPKPADVVPVKQPDPVPVKPSSAVPAVIDTNSIKQTTPLPTDSTGKK